MAITLQSCFARERLGGLLLVLSAWLVGASAPAVQAQEIHSAHCLHGCPLGGRASDDLILREGYVLRSNDVTKLADWVAYRVHREAMGGGGERRWRADPWLAESETLEPEDYRGAHDALGTDRGHQAPLASVSGLRSWEESNYLSNITPQASALNQGPWRALEEAERSFVRLGRAASLYVATGPYYQGGGQRLPGADEAHAVPAGYWKVLALERGAEVRFAAFIFTQETPRDAGHCAQLSDLSSVESISGYRFFHGLDARPDLRLVEGDANLLAGLGCPGAVPSPFRPWLAGG